jgi:integrase
MATIEKYQTSSGATLYAVRHGKPDNKQTWKRGFTTKRDAAAFANTVEVSKLTGSYVAPSLGKVTVGALGPAWLERQRGHMKASSLRAYELAWRNHVAPRWASVAIADVRYTDVASWVAELSGRRGAETVRAAYAVLARIVDDAMRDRLVASNLARGVKLPKAPRRPNVYLSAEQLHRLADESGRYRSLVLLLGTAGLRWGEAAALRVCDVDFLRRRIELHRNAVRVGSSIVVGTLKSGKNRTVVLPASVIDGARRDRYRQGPRRAAVAFSHGLLFGAAVDGELLARGRRSPLPEDRQVLPAGDRSRTAAHRRVAGHPRGRQSEGGPADAWARQRSDDARRVRRSVRVRPRCGGRSARKCAQNVFTGCSVARPFDAENIPTSVKSTPGAASTIT